MFYSFFFFCTSVPILFYDAEEVGERRSACLGAYATYISVYPGHKQKNEHWVEEVGRFAVFMCHVKMTLGRYIGWSVFGQILKSLCSPEPVVPTASFKRTSEILNS